MKATEIRIPNETAFVKLSQVMDGERLIVVDCGVNETGKYGPQGYFVTAEGEQLMLPMRYVEYIKQLMDDPEAYADIKSGKLAIEKSSRESANGLGKTPTFTLFEFED